MKVFITSEPNTKSNEITSKDFLLVEERYDFTTSYLVASNTEEGEDVKIVVCHQLDKSNKMYVEFENEINDIAKKKGLNLIIEHIFINSLKNDVFRNSSVMDSFKDVAKNMGSGDRIFVDLSYSHSLYANMFFAATSYALLTTKNLEIDICGAVQYAQNNKVMMEIVSLESLMLVTKIAARMPMGSREQMDRLINLEIPSFFEENEAKLATEDDEEETEDSDQD